MTPIETVLKSHQSSGSRDKKRWIIPTPKPTLDTPNLHKLLDTLQLAVMILAGFSGVIIIWIERLQKPLS